MGCGGKTLGMPGQRVGVFPAVRPYAAVERHGFIWVWPGDQAKADPALIPYLEWAESPDWAYGVGLYHIQCDYRLMIDSVSDYAIFLIDPGGARAKGLDDDALLRTILPVLDNLYAAYSDAANA